MDTQPRCQSTENSPTITQSGAPFLSPGSLPDDRVQLEISIETLKSLFAAGKLCAADLRCLNDASKASVWELCLSACANRTQCDFSGLESCSSCAHTSGSWYRTALAT